MNPYLIIAALIALAGSYYYGRADGAKVERVAWQARELEAREAYAKKERELLRQYRAKEQESARDMAAVSAAYQRELAHANTARDAALRDLRAGKLRLRDPAAVGQPACGTVLPETGPGPVRRDGGAQGGLSDEASRFLLSLAGEADAVVAQLSSCQRALKKAAGE